MHDIVDVLKWPARALGGSRKSPLGPRAVDPTTVYSFDEDKSFDQGSLGKVCRAEKLEGNEEAQEVCVKVVDVELAKALMLQGVSEFNGITAKDVVNLLLDEIKVLQAMRFCPFIVSYIDSFKWNGKLVTVTELCEPGDIEVVVQKCKPTEEEQCAVLYCIISAIECLHSHHFVHGDVKSANTLLSRDGVVKLCDFGGAEKCDKDGLTTSRSIGTPAFAPPEILRILIEDAKSSDPQPVFHRSRDIWAIGLLALEIAGLRSGLLSLWSQVPNSNPPDLRKLCNALMKGRYGLHESEADRSTKDIDDKYCEVYDFEDPGDSHARRRFVERAMNPNYEERPSAKELLQTEFIQNIKSGDHCRQKLSNWLARLIA